jgi:hypothetical protein
MDCGCVPDLDDGLFARECDYCGLTAASPRCEHDEHQEPCPECSVLPARQLA